MFTFMEKFKQDQKIIIFSHSLALAIFQARGPVGFNEGAGLTSSIAPYVDISRVPTRGLIHKGTKMLRKQGGNGRTRLSLPILWSGKECAVLRILSPPEVPQSLTNSKLRRRPQELVAAIHHIGLQTANYPKGRRTLWIPNTHHAYHLGFILFIYYHSFNKKAPIMKY